MQYIVLAAYLVSLFTLGLVILKLFPLVFPKVIGWMIMMVTGIIVGVPITYFLSCLFAATHEPIRYGVLSFVGVLLLVFVCYLKTRRWREHTILEQKIRYSEICLLVIVVLFSCWLMWKSVRVGTDALLLVSRNTVFDIAHALSLVRSFSLGNNIPFTSPFAAGSVELYHFIFYFFVGLVEQFGVPLVIAFNAVSAFGFSAYCIVGFYIAYILSRKNRIVGWMAIVFLVTHSTMTWWYFLLQQGIGKTMVHSLWQLPNYVYAGPYDGSVISLFFTLNVFVNQRHLAFAIAAGFLFLLMAEALMKQKKVAYWRYFLLGGVIGLLFLWNLVIAVTVIGVVSLLGFFRKKYVETASCFVGCVIVGAVTCMPFLSIFKELIVQQTNQPETGIKTIALFSVVSTQIWYWVQNLGLGIIAFGFGFMCMKKQENTWFVPIGMLFIIVAIGFVLGSNEIAQKMLNFWNVAFVGICACGIWSLWKKGKIVRILSVVLFFGMTASGVIDLMVIKNDFAYPAVTSEMNQRIEKLQHMLPKNAIVISYKEMFHEIAFTGRKQYYGYFAPPAADSRGLEEKDIFESTTAAELDDRMSKTSITHVYLPKILLSDFTYGTNIHMYRMIYPVLYEDGKVILFEVSPHMVQ